MNEEHFQNIWDLLKNAIDKIHSNEASNLSFEELYRSVSRHTLHLVLLALGIFFWDWIHYGIGGLDKQEMAFLGRSWIRRSQDLGLLGPPPLLRVHLLVLYGCGENTGGT